MLVALRAANVRWYRNPEPRPNDGGQLHTPFGVKLHEIQQIIRNLA
jgi:hypothetical protein